MGKGCSNYHQTLMIKAVLSVCTSRLFFWPRAMFKGPRRSFGLVYTENGFHFIFGFHFFENTLPLKKRNPVHSITLYWPDFQSLNSHSNVKIFKKTFTKSCSSWLNASFDTFWVQIDQLGYERWMESSFCKSFLELFLHLSAN